MENKNTQIVRQLCKEIEKYTAREIKTPKDFIFLSEIILTETHQYVSSTTLKRIWGYLKETNNTRVTTLDLLSRFLGYKSWSDFCTNYQPFRPYLQEGEVTSSMLLCTDLRVGQHVEISWKPNSSCILEYIGNMWFRILSSENSRLKSGIVVHFLYIIEGETLYFINAEDGKDKSKLYYVGKTGGIKFKVVK